MWGRSPSPGHALIVKSPADLCHARKRKKESYLAFLWMCAGGLHCKSQEQAFPCHCGAGKHLLLTRLWRPS